MNATHVLNQLPFIHRLNFDVLTNIFLHNAAPGSGIERDVKKATRSSSLTVTRISSQVCRMWRDVLLRSPSIWGRCVDLDLLDQRGDEWRQIVLIRTRRSPLRITSRVPSRIMAPGSGRGAFLANILDEHWDRIEEIDIAIDWDDPADLRDTRLLEPLTRRTDNLRLLRFKRSEIIKRDLEYGGDDRPEFPLEGPLFANHAPRLAYLDLQRVKPRGSYNLRSPTLFNSHMIHLSIDHLNVSASDLLEACSRMPHLLTIHLEIDYFSVDTGCNSCGQRVLMPNLSSITIKCKTLEIYPEFLAYLTPSKGCQLYMEHFLDAHHTINIRSLELMRRIIHRYLQFFIDSQDGLDNIRMSFYPTMCFIYFPDTKFELHYFAQEGSDGLHPAILSTMLDVVAAIKFPSSMCELEFSIYEPRMEVGHPPDIQCKIYHTMKLLDWVTTLTTSANDIILFDKMSGSDSVLFPSLHTLILEPEDSDTDDSPINIENGVLDFLFKRRMVAPIKNFCIHTIESHCER